MNEKFYALPEEKQNRIINAGFKVFAQNSYKKSPVNEIALEAGISKSLLFFYFKNKKDLYIFLLKKVEELTKETLMKAAVSKCDDIFDMMYNGLLAKATMMKAYPDMSNFSIKAYYEKDPDVVNEVREIIAPYTEMKSNPTIANLDLSKFKEGINLRLMYQDIYLASEGYMWRMQQMDNIDIDKIVKDYKEIIEFWKSLYLK